MSNFQFFCLYPKFKNFKFYAIPLVRKQFFSKKICPPTYPLGDPGAPPPGGAPWGTVRRRFLISLFIDQIQKFQVLYNAPSSETFFFKKFCPPTPLVTPPPPSPLGAALGYSLGGDFYFLCL